VINILCDVIADVVDVNMKTRLLISDDRALILVLRVEKGWEAPPNSPDLNPVDYSIWEHSNSLFTIFVTFETLST